MATKNKKAVKKAAKKSAKKAVKKVPKKAVKKVVKKAVKKVAKKSTKVGQEKSVPLSRFCCEQISEGKTDSEIGKLLKKKYPDKKSNDEKTSMYYRKRISEGIYEQYGYPSSILD